MKKLAYISVAAFGATMTPVSPASSATIAGPALNTSDSAFDQTGIQFDALSNSILTQVTFQSQAKSDYITLTDIAGKVLFSTNVAPGSSSNIAVLGWNLVAGNSYRLLQNSANNAEFAQFGGSLPSNSDISITNSNLFHDIGSAANSFNIHFKPNRFWVSFNDITTSGVGAVPEPATWAMMFVGLGMVGFAMRRRPKVTTNVSFA